MALGVGEYRSGGDVFDADGRRVVVVVAAVLPLSNDGPDARDAEGRRVLKVSA